MYSAFKARLVIIKNNTGAHLIVVCLLEASLVCCHQWRIYIVDLKFWTFTPVQFYSFLMQFWVKFGLIDWRRPQGLAPLGNPGSAAGHKAQSDGALVPFYCCSGLHLRARLIIKHFNRGRHFTRFQRKYCFLCTNQMELSRINYQTHDYP